MRLSLTNYTNSDIVIHKLLRTFSENIPIETIRSESEKHPHFPSLLSMSDILMTFNVENLAVSLPYQNLPLVTVPFILHTNLNGGDFLLVNKITESDFYVSNEQYTNHKLSLDEIKQIYNGYVLLCELPENKQEDKQLINLLPILKKSAVTISGAFLLFFLFSATNKLQGLSLPFLLLISLKTIGLLIAVVLLIQTIDNENSIGQRLCKTKGKINCDAILSSETAKVFNGLSWSEIGFFYFASTWILLFFFNGSPLTWPLLSLLNILSLPYTFYSIYYQAKIAKQWCILCCFIQAMLWLELISLLLSDKYLLFQSSQGYEWMQVVFSILLPMFIWFLLRPVFEKALQIRPLKQQFRKFKFNKEFFDNMISMQPKYAEPEKEWSLVLGHEGSDNIITLVTNPFCQPCSKTHKLLEELLSWRNGFQVRIVLAGFAADKDSHTAVSQYLMAIFQNGGHQALENAMHDWFGQKNKNFESWSKKYPVNVTSDVLDKLDRQKAWIKEAEVHSTPTILINGHVLPPIYKINELRYMMTA